MNFAGNMGQALDTAQIYTDFSGLAELRAKAAQNSTEASIEVARQFEALFLQTMLKSMRQASLPDETTDSDQTLYYQEMFDKQIALDLASGKGIGLAAVLQRELGPAAVEPVAKAQPGEFLIPEMRYINASPPTLDKVPNTQVFNVDKNHVGVVDSQALHQPEVTNETQNWKPESPEEFIRELWPQANRAAEKLNVPAEVLIAQAALETGWGSKVIRHEDGKSSFNLFGIKADARWQGEQANVSTLEFHDGIAKREHAAFRSYDSLQDSMNDYVEFLQNSPRYQQALEKSADARTFVQELHKAGYATDPAYAEKISMIMDRDYFTDTVKQVRMNAEGVDRG